MNSTHAQVSQQLLDQGWFVLPWEEFYRLKNTQDILTIDFLFDIKKKLPVRMKDCCVKKALYESKSKFYTRFKYKGFVPTICGENEVKSDKDCTFLLNRSTRFFWTETSSNIVPSDFFWVFLKKKDLDHHESIELFDVSTTHDHFSDDYMCCAIMLCIGLCAATCWACGQALSEG